MDSDPPLNYLVLASLERRIEELLDLAERIGEHLVMYPAVFTIGQAEPWKEEALRLAAEAEAARKKGPPYVTRYPPATPRADCRDADDPYGSDLTSSDSYPWSDALPVTPIPEATKDHPADTNMAGHLPLAPDGLLSDWPSGLDVGC